MCEFIRENRRRLYQRNILENALIEKMVGERIDVTDKVKNDIKQLSGFMISDLLLRYEIKEGTTRKKFVGFNLSDDIRNLQEILPEADRKDVIVLLKTNHKGKVVFTVDEGLS